MLGDLIFDLDGKPRFQPDDFTAIALQDQKRELFELMQDVTLLAWLAIDNPHTVPSMATLQRTLWTLNGIAGLLSHLDALQWEIENPAP